MKAIILAAGQGQRLQPFTDSLNKVLIPVKENKGPLHIAIEQLHRIGFSMEDITVVTGYRSDDIEIEYPDVFTVYNPKFATSNNAVSLLAGLMSFQTNEDILVLNGDLVVDSHLSWQIDEIVDGAESGDSIPSINLLVDEGMCGHEAMKVTLVENRVTEIGKEIPLSRTDGEFIGMMLIRSSSLLALRNYLSLTLAREGVGVWYEHAINFAIHHGFNVSSTAVRKGSFWIELDTIDDLNMARRVFRSRGI